MLGAKFFREAHPTLAKRFPEARFVAHANATPERLGEIATADWSAACSPAALLDALLAGLGDTQPSPEKLEQRRARLTTARAEREQIDGPYAPVARALHDVLDHGWLVDESVSASQFVVSAMSSADGSRFLTTGGASLGWATGAACGVALAADEPVTCLLGDGSLRFGMHALWTARALDLNIRFVVIDNAGYGSTRHFERDYVARSANDRGAAYLGSDLASGPGCAGLVRGFGIPCDEVAADGDVRGRVEQLWSSRGPRALVVTVSAE